MADEISNRSYSGMTVNERLYVSGLMSEFDIVKRKNLHRAIAILQEVGLGRKSIYPILKIRHSIPVEILLDSFCNYYPTNAVDRLKDYNLSKTQKKQIINRKRVDKIFTFSTSELLFFLEQNGHVCDRLITESYDKRSAPSSFITEEKDFFKVGNYDNDYRDVKTWKNKNEAVTDYLLLSWNLERLSTTY
jgi:hypothetical protein